MSTPQPFTESRINEEEEEKETKCKDTIGPFALTASSMIAGCSGGGTGTGGGGGNGNTTTGGSCSGDECTVTGTRRGGGGGYTGGTGYTGGSGNENEGDPDRQALT